MKAFLILILGGLQASALSTDRKSIETLMSDYVRQVSHGDKGSLKIDESFQDRWDDDADELKVCEKESCKVKFRKPIADTGDEDTEIYEVQLDIVHSGDVLARRSGCYVVVKEGDVFRLHDYKYECAE